MFLIVTTKYHKTVNSLSWTTGRVEGVVLEYPERPASISELAARSDQNRTRGRLVIISSHCSM